MPRYTARTPPPRGSGLARATDISTLTRTGEAEKWKGIQSAGRAIRDISDKLFAAQQKRQAIDARLQHAQITGDIAGYVENYLHSLDEADVQSDKSRTVIHNESMAKVEKYRQNARKALDSQEARDAEELSWRIAKPGYEKKIWSKLSSRLDAYQLGVVLEKGENLVQNNKVEQAQELYRAARDEGLLAPGPAQSLINNAPERARRATRIRVDAEAKRILKDEGLPAAVAFVASVSSDILPLDLAASIIGGLEKIDELAQKTEGIKVGLRQEANNEAAVKELAKKLGNPEEWPTLDEIHDNTAILPDDKLSWEFIVKGLSEKPAIKTDWKKLLELEMKLFDRWDGNIRAKDLQTGEFSRVLIETEIASACCVDKYIDRGKMVELISRLSLDVPHRTTLKEAFLEIKELARAAPSYGTLLSVLGALHLSQGEAERAAWARAELLDWVIKESAKRDVTPQQITVRARELITSAKPVSKPAASETTPEVAPKDLSELTDKELVERMTSGE